MLPLIPVNTLANWSSESTSVSQTFSYAGFEYLVILIFTVLPSFLLIVTIGHGVLRGSPTNPWVLEIVLFFFLTWFLTCICTSRPNQYINPFLHLLEDILLWHEKPNVARSALASNLTDPWVHVTISFSGQGPPDHGSQVMAKEENVDCSLIPRPRLLALERWYYLFVIVISYILYSLG